jgi:hypothetical protein
MKQKKRGPHNSLASSHTPSGSIYNNIYFEGVAEREWEVKDRDGENVMNSFRCCFLQIQARKLLAK